MRPLRKRLRRWGGDFLWRLRSKFSELRARRKEPPLFNAALGRPARQSSTHGQESRHGAQRGTDGRVGGRGSFRARRADPQPWWMVDLKADWPIHSIRIHPCRDLPATTAAWLQVSLSADGERWEVIHASRHLFGDHAASGPLIIRLLDTRGARFVKLALPEGGQLAFNQVEVMVERRHRAMRRVAKRYGFAFELMTSLRMKPRARPYSLRNVPPGFKGEIEAFHVNRRQGRFGNNLQQIGMAVCLARHLGIRRVYLCKMPLLEIDRPVTFGDVTVLPESEMQREKPRSVLCGTFYYPNVFGRGFQGRNYRHIAEAARAVGQPIFHRLAARPTFVPEATDLAIHLRAGDIFRRDNPHPLYVQPPFAFYRLCIEFARAEMGVARVVLVYEDEGNPCVGALKTWLDEIGLPYAIQSRTFKEDLAVLMAARHCIFGRGTFGPAVGILSRNMRVLFRPWLEERLGALREVCNLEVIDVDDIAGHYIKVGDWRNTPVQRQVMLDYPLENLRLSRSALLPDRRGAAEEPPVVAPQPQI